MRLPGILFIDLLTTLSYEGCADFLQWLGSVHFFLSVLLKNVHIMGIFLKCLVEFAGKDILPVKKDLNWDAWVHSMSSSEASKVISIVNQRT